MVKVWLLSRTHFPKGREMLIKTKEISGSMWVPFIIPESPSFSHPNSLVAFWYVLVLLGTVEDSRDSIKFTLILSQQPKWSSREIKALVHLRQWLCNGSYLTLKKSPACSKALEFMFYTPASPPLPAPHFLFQPWWSLWNFLSLGSSTTDVDPDSTWQWSPGCPL